jgi:RNA polymerase sigma factor (TIGR02999 family)
MSTPDPERPAEPAPDPVANHVTHLLLAARDGQTGASDELLSLVYDQLRHIARNRMAGERDGHTLRATELVHEAYLKLGRQLGERDWQSRGQFFAAAAEAMRRILIDHARRRGAQRREGGHHRLPLLSVIDLAEEDDPESILAVEEAIACLEKEDERLGRIVRLRFYAGLSLDETARSLDLSRRTVHRDWTYARAWLYDALREELGWPAQMPAEET